MNILKTSCLNGPNYWSNFRKKLIVLKIDLEKYELLPTNELNNFLNALTLLMPSLYEHRCSPGVKGGFFQRVEEGTWLGHVIEHVALELQSLAGMECGFGRTFGTSVEGVYHVIFSYEFKEAGLYAGQAAVAVVQALAEGKNYLSLDKDIQQLKNIADRERLGPSTQSLVDEASLRNIPVHRISQSLITLGYGCKQKKIWTSVTSKTSAIGVDVVADKELTKQILASHYIPVPKGYVIDTIEELGERAKSLGYPLVTKPTHGNHGRGITTNIQNKEQLLLGFQFAKEVSQDIIIERFITGDDYRILVVNYKVVAVSKRTPAHIIGNGNHSIGELIEQLNADPRRGDNHNNFLTKMNIDETTQHLLLEKGLNLNSILPKGNMLYLKKIANLSAGGTAKDMTDEIHPANKLLAERVARIVGLDICGIDIVCSHINKPLTELNGAVLEVNAGPGLRMHISPNEGMSRNVAKPIMDMLFPNKDHGRIPIVGVTGTNGKTTVVTLIAKLAQRAGHEVGYTSTQGIYVNEQLVYSGDCSGPVSAQTILNDPCVNFAVLECARGGILRQGLGFDECNISVITNITGDHLGLNEINTLDELARLKGVLAHSTKKDGYAILNAEDEYTCDFQEDLDCNIALFGLAKNQVIQSHCEQGGLAVYIHQGVIVIEGPDIYEQVCAIKDIPLTYNGTASCMVSNVLPVVLAGFISKFSLELIRTFLQSLQPHPDVVPGRMNLFTFPRCKVMIDYAHNEGAFIELKKYIATLNYDKYIGIIGAAGDRRDEDIITLGRLSAQLFDEIIIRHDLDGRTRTNQQITDLLLEGINSYQKRKVVIISDEAEAITYSLNQSHTNTFIFYAVEDVFKSIKMLSALQKNQQFNVVEEEYV